MRALDALGQNYVAEVPADLTVWTRRPEVLYRAHSRQRRMDGRKPDAEGDDAGPAAAQRRGPLLATGKFAPLPLEHVNRYDIQATSPAGAKLVSPATAPDIHRTVVILPQ